MDDSFLCFVLLSFLSCLSVLFVHVNCELTLFVNIIDHAQTRTTAVYVAGTIKHSPYLYFIHLIVGSGFLKAMIGALTTYICYVHTMDPGQSMDCPVQTKPQRLQCKIPNKNTNS